MPLLLIPGGFLSTDSMEQWVAGFVAKRPVIVFDQQGHGRTPDTRRRMSYEQFGDDAAVLLRALEVSISAAVPVLEPMITAFLDDVPPASPSLW